MVGVAQVILIAAVLVAPAVAAALGSTAILLFCRPRWSCLRQLLRLFVAAKMAHVDVVKAAAVLIVVMAR